MSVVSSLHFHHKKLNFFMWPFSHLDNKILGSDSGLPSPHWARCLLFSLLFKKWPAPRTGRLWTGCIMHAFRECLLWAHAHTKVPKWVSSESTQQHARCLSEKNPLKQTHQKQTLMEYLCIETGVTFIIPKKLALA